MTFEEAMDRMGVLGVSATEFAAEVGVSLNSISRARMATGNRRPPPKEWRSIAQRFLTERAAAINDLALELADA